MLPRRPYSGSKFRPVALTIAGFDPSGGAGILADIKTFESMGVYGLAIITGNTHQNDIAFNDVTWLDKKEKKKNIALLAERFPVEVIKLGMHKNLEDVLNSIKLCEKYFPQAFFVWDPVLSASAGFDLNIKIQKATLNKILSSLSLITPNLYEVSKLMEFKSVKEAASILSRVCAVLLKGGHSKDVEDSTDYLFVHGRLKKEYTSPRLKGDGKHGSGCVLSAAITASLAKGDTLENAISKGKEYVTYFLKSNNTLLGYHSN
ncbi:MAG TPA: hydroxymethylpyrimidine/phosphomethylpyrimidine kinase [Bacteroidia bacterium]|jgi:hydroxymethylpyrimidine/phosphomethylpyrimidine kinase|nr:hydroxymethylpyrimidine/phosphomethylpyrimidine kinase [Bacteroidia bacterium]